MYRCYGNYNIAERDSKIGKIATNVKHIFIIGLFHPRHTLMNTVYWIK